MTVESSKKLIIIAKFNILAQCRKISVVDVVIGGPSYPYIRIYCNELSPNDELDNRAIAGLFTKLTALT